MNENLFQIIFAIVEMGRATKILEAAEKVGAEGGTIFYGRGTGVHEHEKILGISIEPEKEIIMILINKQIADTVLDTVISAGELNKPGRGLVFVMDISKVVGICHDPSCTINDEF